MLAALGMGRAVKGRDSDSLSLLHAVKITEKMQISQTKTHSEMSPVHFLNIIPCVFSFFLFVCWQSSNTSVRCTALPM